VDEQKVDSSSRYRESLPRKQLHQYEVHRSIS
jgi:hypothetical protein